MGSVRAGGVQSVLEQSMLPEDDPLNMSIHSRRNVWETKIVDSEEQQQQARSMQQQLMAAKMQQKHASPGEEQPRAKHRQFIH